jgi:hypothetical protein
MAARQAVPLASEMIEQIGPAALLSKDPPPQAPLDPRVRVNNGQVRRIAEKLSTLSEAAPFPFVSPELPPVGYPKALEYFFAATLQQFSFWSVRSNRYYRPLIARIGSVLQKGSNYLRGAFSRQIERWGWTETVQRSPARPVGYFVQVTSSGTPGSTSWAYNPHCRCPSGH